MEGQKSPKGDINIELMVLPSPSTKARDEPEMAEDQSNPIQAPIWDVTNRGPMQSLGNFNKKGQQVQRSAHARKQAAR